MAQPTLSGLTLNVGSGGADLLHDVIDSKIGQVILVGYSTGDGTANVVMADTGLPVVAQSGATWAVTQSGTWNITDVSGTISLPTGASTAANQATANTALAAIKTAVEGVLTVGSHAVTNAGTFAVQVTSAPITAVTGTFWQDTQPISAAALPLPSGAATESTLATLDGKVTACNTGAVVISSGVITRITNTVAVTGMFWQATQPVSLASVPSHAVTNAGTFVVQVDGDALTALQLIDDAVAADGQAYGKGILVQGDDGTDRRALLVGTDGHLQVDVVSAPTTAVTGTFWQGTQPVSLASVPSHAVTNAGTFVVQIDGDALTALQLIDDAVAADGQAYGKGVLIQGDDGSDRRAVLVDATGHLQIDVLSAPTTAVTGTFWQATQPVSLASVPSHAVTNAGTFVVQIDGDALTALQLIDDAVAVLGTATYAEATTKGTVIGAVRNDDLAALANTDNEITPLQVDPNGALYVNPAAAEPKRASGVAAGGAPGTDDMIAAVATRKLRILALGLFATSATVNNVFVDNADNDLLFNNANPLPLSLDADADTVPGFVLPFNPGGWFETDTVNEAVTLNSSAAQDIGWTITYIEVP